MLISIIVAMDEKRGIGIGNQLPWHLPDDLQHFKKTTMGHHILMGRKTFESLNQQPLPGRINIILTRNPAFTAGGKGVVVEHSLGDALARAQHQGEREVFITGGANLYRQSLPMAHRLYLTLVHAQTEADVFFPRINFNNWTEQHSKRHPADKRHSFAFTTKLLVRSSQG